MSEPNVRRRPALLILLAALIYLESAALAVISVVLLIDLLTQRPDSYASGVAILILALLATAWLAVMATHALLGRAWIRGGTVTWQVLQIAIGIGSFGGLFSRPDIGWVLIIPAVVVLVLLFTPTVIRATKRPESPADE
ncbi:hypothetical protein [Lacisediminihabitans changchengi]|uniref:Uncharacterized protein n=1 Tax=Lacisediminihabitans changchengi TaxID=2787634 RepID=A0A934SIU6_9MICO|nr:hypothetical protein [Lacisediminihabitans changchengi]MBK4346393.1 hypothetical protein [Lacisediminihabitans changchengi]